jgi:very-short-patch-repair endonuclease
MGRIPPINRRPFTSPNAGRSPALSSEACEEAAGGGTARARKLRKNPTDAEQRMWYALRLLKPLGMHFRRQPPIGPYFPDFACHRSKLVVELDGSQHAEDAAVQYDAQRTAFLNSRGYRVLRFWNSDVLENRDCVVEIIITAAKPPHPPGFAGRPPRVGGGEMVTSASHAGTHVLAGDDKFLFASPGDLPA